MRIKMIAPRISDNATSANVSEIAPVIHASTLLLQEGENNRRSWGCVKVTSTIVVKTRTFAAIHIGVCHKHRGGQQWYYYEKPNGKAIRRLTARQLSTRRRNQVLDAFRDGNAPDWADIPFVENPKTNGKPERHIRYKKVAYCDGGELRSIYDGSAYVIGKTRRQAVQSDHGGGFYVYRSPEVAAEQTAFPADSVFDELSETRILKCEVWGRHETYAKTRWVLESDFETYDEFEDHVILARRDWCGKVKVAKASEIKEAWTYCKPLEVVA